jgi:IS30 family transposase
LALPHKPSRATWSNQLRRDGRVWHRCSATFDHLRSGSELARHLEITAATGAKVFFCDAGSPWQRGTSENTNGLLHQYLPKRADLSRYSRSELFGLGSPLAHQGHVALMAGDLEPDRDVASHDAPTPGHWLGRPSRRRSSVR